jgi:hypothetical protein
MSLGEALSLPRDIAVLLWDIANEEGEDRCPFMG